MVVINKTYRMIFKYSSRKKQIGILSILFLMVVIYAIYRHYLRPYAIQYSDSRFLKDLLYTFPNFWGSFMLYLMSKYFLEIDMVCVCIGRYI